jgi:hypothetical protein
MAAEGPDSLETLDDVRRFVLEGYRASGDPNSRRNRGRPLEFGFEWGKLPLTVAEPGPLIERAVRISGDRGLSLQELRGLFAQLGKDRLDRGLAFARDAGVIVEKRESRPNRAGRPQKQVVLYPTGDV